MLSSFLVRFCDSPCIYIHIFDFVHICWFIIIAGQNFSKLVEDMEIPELKITLNEGEKPSWPQLAIVCERMHPYLCSTGGNPADPRGMGWLTPRQQVYKPSTDVAAKIGNTSEKLAVILEHGKKEKKVSWFLTTFEERPNLEEFLPNHFPARVAGANLKSQGAKHWTNHIPPAKYSSCRSHLLIFVDLID